MPERRPLRRSVTDRKIAGVAGGMAEYLDLDPTLVRVAWVVAVIFGVPLVLYFVLWIVLPEGDGVTAAKPAISIAEERYARGEITAEELARIKSDLTS